LKERCEVLVVYEDAITRAEAVRFCDSLVQKFWAQNDFEIEWCPFVELQSQPYATQRAEAAATANLLAFALHPETALPWDLHSWVESWLKLRGEREGAVFGLLDNSLSGEPSGLYCFLRQTAHRAGMDYLTQIPESIQHLMPESPEDYTQRAARITSLLDEILQDPSQSARLGSPK
jgi:hypothetical protein